MTQNNDNAIQKDLGQRILVQEVKSFSQIQQLDDKLPIKAIYELTENGNERFFASYPVQASNWLAEKFNLDALQNCFYICPYGVSIVKDWDIRHEKSSFAVTVTLDLEVKLDVEQSDSGMGLVNWLAGNDWRMDQRSLENYIGEKLTSGFLEETLGLYCKPWNELKSGCLKLNINDFRNVVGSWLAVKECVVRKAAEKPSQSWLDRNKTLKENARIQQKHQDELDDLDREKERLIASIEVEKLKQEYENLKAGQITDVEKARLDKKYQTICGMYRVEKKKNGSGSIISNDWEVGHKINGKYLVVAPPGEGSIGKVYKCWDEIGKVDVAVKRLPHGSFQSEAEMTGVWENYQMISGLDHQNIAHYKALEIDKATGDNYLVMEYVEGEELRDWMNRLSEVKDMDKRLQTALPVLKKIADALDDVHGKNVIHRDVKPDNVKIKPNGTVKVLDFGLAVKIDRDTHMGYIPDRVIASAGSDGYKSPEQWKASCDQGPSVDQYSLAVMGYEMLSGRLPFMRYEWDQEVSEKKNKKKRMLPQKVKGLPNYANKALQKALSMEAADRYLSCVEFVNALGAEKAGADSGIWRAWFAVVAVLILIALLGVYVWKGQSFKKPGLYLPPSAPVGEEKKTKGTEEATKALVKQLEAEKTKTADLSAKVAAGEDAKNELEKQLKDLQKKTEDLVVVVAAGEDAKRALEAEKGKEKELEVKVAAGIDAKKDLEKQLEAEKRKTKELEAKVAAGEDAKRALQKTEELAKSTEDAKKALEKQLEEEKKKTKELEAKVAANKALEAKASTAAERKIEDGDFTLMLPGNVPLELVKIQAGTFTMGSPSDEPGRGDDETQHSVTLTKDYWLGKYEVTQGQWQAVMGSNPSYFKGDRYPVERVNWEDAMAFCRKVTDHERASGHLPAGYEYTLPTEAQWEYACRAGTTTPFSFGSMLNGDWANFGGNYPRRGVEKGRNLGGTSEVGIYAPNAWGLYDMHGNVWEWCRDWYESGYAKDPEFLRGNSGSYCVLRGGSFFNFAEDGSSAARFRRDPTYRSHFIGFRVALAPVESIPTTQIGEKASSAPVQPEHQINSLAPSDMSQSKVVLLPGNVPLELVKIQAGSFTMGSPLDEPGRHDDEIRHHVKLTKDFWLGQFEVTQEQWTAIMGSNPSCFKEGVNYPVENISWKDAMTFCKEVTKLERKAGRLPAKYEYTLPTEAQWEYACRAGTSTPFSFGSTLNGDNANCDGFYPYGAGMGKSLQCTSAVGSYEPNAWGLYDMHGNLWEWCRDLYGAYPSDMVSDPIGPSFGSHRVLRGGSWRAYARNCRTADRNSLAPTFCGSEIGFRVALVAIP